MTIELDYRKIRQTLEEERSNIMQRLADHDPQNGRQSDRNLDRADLARSYTLQERNTLLAEREQERLTQIETALQKLDDEAYGLCDNCGQAIAPGRLKVLPYAELCIGCQSNQGS